MEGDRRRVRGRMIETLPMLVANTNNLETYYGEVGAYDGGRGGGVRGDTTGLGL